MTLFRENEDAVLQKNRKIRPSKYKSEKFEWFSNILFSVDGRILRARQNICPENKGNLCGRIHTRFAVTKITRWPDKNPTSEIFDGSFDGFSDFRWTGPHRCRRNNSSCSSSSSTGSSSSTVVGHNSDPALLEKSIKEDLPKWMENRLNVVCFFHEIRAQFWPGPDSSSKWLLSRTEGALRAFKIQAAEIRF